jgi:hypothetical protein
VLSKGFFKHDLECYIMRNFLVCAGYLGLLSTEMCVMSWTCNAIQNDGGRDAYRIFLRNIDIWRPEKKWHDNVRDFKIAVPNGSTGLGSSVLLFHLKRQKDPAFETVRGLFSLKRCRVFRISVTCIIYTFCVDACYVLSPPHLP